MTKIEIRGPSGLGDAIYMNPITIAFSRMFDRVLVRTKFPEIFKYCDKVDPVAFKKGGADKEFNYGGKRRKDTSTTQWQDLLITAGLSRNTPYEIHWKLTNVDLARDIKLLAKGRKIMVVSMPHTPFDRLDKFGLELIPNWKPFPSLIRHAQSKGYFVIQAGKGKWLYDLSRVVDLDLKNLTTACDIMDLGLIGDVFFGQCGFIVPLAEGNNKELFLIFARKGLNSNTEFLKNITGKKVCSTQKGRSSVDDESLESLIRNFDQCL